MLEEYISVIRFHASDILRKMPPQSIIEFNDLVNSGVIGLISSYDRFDESKGTLFKTFAGFRVRGEMIDYVRLHDYKPRSIRDDEKEIKSAIRLLTHRGNGVVLEEDIIKELGISKEKYRERLDLVNCSEVISYEDLKIRGNSEDEALSFIDNVEDRNTVPPTYFLELNETLNFLTKAIDSLTKKQQIIIQLYYIEELSMKEVGIIFNNTEGRVSQIVKETTLKMKVFMENNGYTHHFS